MEDYPRNLSEFEARFASEEACREYLCRLRWPEGFRCPRCGGGRSWPVRVVWLQCADCGRQTSVTAGTIFQDTRTSLKLWFQAIVVVDHPEERGQCLGASAGAGPEAVPNGLDLATQAALRDGQARTGSADRKGRGR